MEYRRIPGSDLDVSAISFGMMYGSDARKDPSLKARALRRALESGVTCIHSCVEYGTWPVLASVLDEWPQRRELVHIIKMDVPNHDDDNLFSASKFRRRVEDHLRALRTDCIHILQYMWRIAPGSGGRSPVPHAADHRRCRGHLRAASRRGQGRLPDDLSTRLVQIRGHRHRPFLGPDWSLQPRPPGLRLPLSAIGEAQYGLPRIQSPSRRNPDGQAQELPLPGKRDRRNNEFYRGEYEKRRRIEEFFADEIGTSLTGFALRALLASPAVACLITGMSTEEQVDEVLSAAEGPPLPAATFDRALEFWRTQLQ